MTELDPRDNILSISDHFKPPTGIEKWNAIGFDIAPWEQVWKLVHFNKTSEFVDLDFKITHNIIILDYLSMASLYPTSVLSV